jgi:hypothetical protein
MKIEIYASVGAGLCACTNPAGTEARRHHFLSLPRERMALSHEASMPAVEPPRKARHNTRRLRGARPYLAMVVI